MGYLLVSYFSHYHPVSQEIHLPQSLGPGKNQTTQHSHFLQEPFLLPYLQIPWKWEGCFSLSEMCLNLTYYCTIKKDVYIHVLYNKKDVYIHVPAEYLLYISIKMSGMNLFCVLVLSFICRIIKHENIYNCNIKHKLFTHLRIDSSQCGPVSFFSDYFHDF